jgi:hypothetical protein
MFQRLRYRILQLLLGQCRLMRAFSSVLVTLPREVLPDFVDT